MRNSLIFCILAFILASPSFAQDRLHPGETLENDRFIQSPNGKYKLIMQADGSLVMYRSDGTIRYSMEKRGYHAVMQEDGNFVQYKFAYRDPLWSTGTGGRCPCPNPHYLRIWDDGDLTVTYGMLGQVQYGTLWSLGPDPKPPATGPVMMYEPVLPGPRPTYMPDPYLPSSY